MDCADFSVVILTYNRPQQVLETVASVEFVAARGGRVIVVDNAADPRLAHRLRQVCGTVEVIMLHGNPGVAGRNAGLRRVITPYAITLDDDVRGVTLSDLQRLRRKFEQQRDLAAICFKVVSENEPHRVLNWCHHRKVEEFANATFVTNEISEGAVAFRMQALRETRLYPEDFFISHEGPALVMRLMNRGYQICYSPEVVVTHAVAQAGRPGWRRYYFDTRNVIWLAVGHLPPIVGLRTVVRGVGALLIYSLRDGYFTSWARGVWDGLRGCRRKFEQREVPTQWARQQLKSIDRERPGFFYMVKRRLFRRGVQI